MLTRFTARTCACICWWLALVTAAQAVSEVTSSTPSSAVGIVALCTAVVLFAAGVGFWKGSDDDLYT